MLIWIGAAVFAMAMVGCVVWCLAGKAAVAARLAAIHARGEPLTFADLDAAYPHPPPTEDTTELLLTAGQAVADSLQDARWRALPFVGEGRDPPPLGQPWSELDTARQFLSDNTAALEQLHRAAQHGCRARFAGVVTPDAINAVLDYARALRTASRALCLEAVVNLHAGDIQAAARSLITALKLQTALENEPLLVSQLVRAGVFGAAAHELRRALVDVDFSLQELLLAQDTLSTIDFQRGLIDALLGERVLGLSMLAGATPTNSAAATAAMRLWSALNNLEKVKYLDLMGKFLAAAREPWPEFLTRSHDIVASYSANTAQAGGLTNSLATSVNMSVQSLGRAELTRRLLIVAIAIERYRQKHGTAPDTLAALVPDFLSEVPIDPTDGRSFSYRADGAGYVLYSATQRFPLPSGEAPDSETGANPSFVIRRVEKNSAARGGEE